MPAKEQNFRVVPKGDRWAVETNGIVAELAYVTKESAFEAIVAAAETAMLEGEAINIFVPGGAEGRWA